MKNLFQYKFNITGMEFFMIIHVMELPSDSVKYLCGFDAIKVK